AMAWRRAGPITGNSAWARGRGPRRTDAVTADSTEGASALVSWGSVARSAIASGSTRLTSRVWMAGSCRCACRAISSRRSGPRSSDRSSEKLSRSVASAFAWPLPLPSAARSGSPPTLASTIAGVLGVRQREVVGQTHGHFIEQRGQGRAIGLVVAQFTRFVRQPCEHLVDLAADLVGEALVLLEDLLPQFALALRQLLVDRRRPALERGRGLLDLARHG